MNRPLNLLEHPELAEEFDFDELEELPEVDPIDIVLFRFLETNTGHGSFEERIALLERLLDEYDETDDSFLLCPKAVTVVPSADSRALGLRMASLTARMSAPRLRLLRSDDPISPSGSSLRHLLARI